MALWTRGHFSDNLVLLAEIIAFGKKIPKWDSQIFEIAFFTLNYSLRSNVTCSIFAIKKIRSIQNEICKKNIGSNICYHSSQPLHGHTHLEESNKAQKYGTKCGQNYRKVQNLVENLNWKYKYLATWTQLSRKQWSWHFLLAPFMGFKKRKNSDFSTFDI